VPSYIRFGFRFGWSATARALGRLLARHGGCEQPPVSWRHTGGPWFGNQLMTLTLSGRSARLRLDQARESGEGRTRLVTVSESELTGGSGREASRLAR
jgi:hypothetical protein